MLTRDVGGDMGGRARVRWFACVIISLSLAACSGGGDGNPVFETEGCIKTRVEFAPVSAKVPADLRLAARLVTISGEPVPGRDVDFAVRSKPGASASTLMSATTDVQGYAKGDVYANLLPGGTDIANMRSATRMVADYDNPDALNREAQPNYCSSNTEVDFRYTGPLPS